MRFVPSRDMPEAVTEATEGDMRKVAEAIADEARRLTPVATGTARDSITVGKDEYGWHVRAGGGDAWYFVFIETGTSDTPKFAPMRRAAEAVDQLERRRE